LLIVYFLCPEVESKLKAFVEKLNADYLIRQAEPKGDEEDMDKIVAAWEKAFMEVRSFVE
jgi:hypothetical protein